MFCTLNQSEKPSPFQYLRTKMILWIMVFLFPILIILCVSMNRILSAYSQQMSANYSQSLREFTADIDSSLTAAKRILYSENNLSEFLWLEPGSGTDALENMQKYGDHLVETLTIQEKLDAFFVYDGKKILFVQNYNTSYKENKRMAEALEERISQDREAGLLSEYQTIKTEDGYYLYMGTDLEEGVFGCWFSAERLLEDINDTEMQGVVDFFLSFPEGTSLSASYDFMNPEQRQELFADYSVTSQELSAAPFSLTVLWDRDVIYETLYQTQRLLVSATILAFLLMIVYLFFLHRSLFVPLRQLIKNIDRLGLQDCGELERPRKESTEFQSIYNALIFMAGEIRELRIHVYEKELLQQRTQLELYQLQIRPHFFLNALNNIQCLNRSEKQTEADEMIGMLTRHCRYVLYSSQFVLLDEELSFVQNYVKLQRVQHDRQYKFEVSCPEELRDYEIPILIIQILVENSIKHAGGLQEALEIWTVISGEKREGTSFLQIAVADNGPGFSTEFLYKSQEICDFRQSGDNHGIGIRNIQRRLTLIYGDIAFMEFKNRREGGGMVILHIPISSALATAEISVL